MTMKKKNAATCWGRSSVTYTAKKEDESNQSETEPPENPNVTEQRNNKIASTPR
jgi:hypothetical protein